MRIFVAVIFILIMGFQTVESSQEFGFEFESFLGSDDHYFQNYRKVGLTQYAQTGDQILLLNINGYTTESDFKGGSYGVAYRKKYNSLLLGINAYHDFQKSSLTLNQFGFGFEVISQYTKFWANIYLPLSSKRFDEKYFLFDDYEGGYIVSCTEKSIVPKAFDANVTVHGFKGDHFYTSLSLGIYGIDYYQYEKLIGLKVWGKVEYFEQVYIEPEVCYDRCDGISLGIRVGISYPAAKSSKYSNSAYASVNRQTGIPIRRFCDYQTNY